MSSEPVLIGGRMLRQDAVPLNSVAQLRAIEAHAASGLPPHTLMQRAGLSLARLILALAPHARRIWIACGPGNNGGDGFEAAAHLKSWGKHPIISYLTPEKSPQDASFSIAKAQAIGVEIGAGVPTQFDFCVDALFGIGLQRPLVPPYVDWVHAMHASGRPILAVDCPSGLDADTGCTHDVTVRAHATVSFLGLKPGLFTAQGRDVCGDLWLDTLDVGGDAAPAAQLNPRPQTAPRAHASHKGTYGDVAVVGGATGMLGASLLAARAALHAGAGRVYVVPLDPLAPPLDITQPELMFRAPQSMDWGSMTVVAGCGGGNAIEACLPTLLNDSARLVLDADALNALAVAPALANAVVARGSARPTVLTPHPLEAARLLGADTAAVQRDRLRAAQALAERFGAFVVLKGSGTVVATPGRVPCINPTGDARLATAGSGDVLAGMVGAFLASGTAPWDAVVQAVYRHGQLVEDNVPTGPVVPASRLLTAR